MPKQRATAPARARPGNRIARPTLPSGRQQFKTIYFADATGTDSKKRSLTLAFGTRDGETFRAVRGLSSEETRQLLGFRSLGSLRQAAIRRGMSVNSYCLAALRRATREAKYPTGPAGPARVSEAAPFTVDPLQATFRGGGNVPGHLWFPLVEGYSPNFVETIAREFAPEARSVLDPFAGTGTTALTASRMGLLSYYSELNPVLQASIALRSTVGLASTKERAAIIDSLHSLADQLDAKIAASQCATDLEAHYSASFGSSRYFDAEAFDAILRLRSVIDGLRADDSLVADLLELATAASLVPSSRLIRRGDLRFKRPSEARRGAPRVAVEVKARLLQMASDTRRMPVLLTRPTLISEDARSLASIPSVDADLVITSPPYLNGTNYFRNTKLELWFLRALRNPEDLSGFRRRAVTAGINDVTRSKQPEDPQPLLEDLLDELSRRAYDPRIPAMVAMYFNDMSAVLRGVREHLVPGGVLAVDIGDSQYGGVNVPTHELLCRIVGDLGFTLVRSVPLRKRLSRSGSPLTQFLLVFRRNGVKQGGHAARTPVPTPGWSGSWERFKKELPHQRGAFAKRNWGHPMHSLCSYQGKMKPSLAAHLVRTFVPSGGRLLDPFGGVGTIPFEACLQGNKAWAFEISPAALAITRAKLGRSDPHVCDALVDALASFLDAAYPSVEEQESLATIRFNRPLADYFHPETLREVVLARRFFMQHPPGDVSSALVLASLLHILHGNRPYALSRRSHPITPFAPTGPTTYRPLLPRLRGKLDRSLGAVIPPEFEEGQAFFQDATESWPHEVADLDAIVTSPPFFDSTRFYLANWMRLWFCGWDANDFRKRPLRFVDERQKQGFDVYEPLLRQARERLKPNGVVVLHLGKSSKCDMASELARLARRWFRVADTFAETVGHCESHGIRDKGTVNQHQFLVLN